MGLRERIRQARMRLERKQLWNAIALAVVCVLLIGVVCYQAKYYMQLKQNEEQYESLRETEVTERTEAAEWVEIETETESLPGCEAVYDFAELKEQKNKDIYAWITVPGTQVDYPVLQSETDNYYLERNLDHSSGYPGCIYSNKCNTQDFSDYITVLYGHNMKNGSMFGCLHSYEKQEFFDENREIIVYTEDRRLTYEIYASVKFTDEYIPAYYNIESAAGRDEFLASVRKECENSSVSHISETVEIQPEDKLLTLSTCVSGERNRRYLIVGVLREEAFYM